jgi:esterase/lipase superfamily enzyme
MRDWHIKSNIPFEELVDRNDPAKLHLSDWATGAIAETLKVSIVDGLSRVKEVHVARGKIASDANLRKEWARDKGQGRTEGWAKNDQGGSYFDQPGSAQPPWIDDSTARRVTLLFATTRCASNNTKEIFSGEREPEATHYGMTSIKIPGIRSVGTVSLPTEWKLFNIRLYKQSLDPSHHFVLENCRTVTKENWLNTVRLSSPTEALGFVHGLNVSFRDGLYKCAQIAWDIRYPGLPISFSWASRGTLSLTSYMYDQNSALDARRRVVALLRDLQAAGITALNVIAHSIGNYAVLDALANHSQSDGRLALGNVMMAAPDVDHDHYRNTVKRVLPMTRGMTLCASSRDKAMKASRKLAGKPRAADVPENGPSLLPSSDSTGA